MDTNVQLSGNGILLVPCQMKHLNDLYNIAVESLPEFMPWLTWVHTGLSIEQFKQWLSNSPEEWANGNGYDFAISRLNDGSILGLCGFSKLDPTKKIANLYYWVRTSETKQGVASTAASLLARWGIETLKLQRIEFHISSLNIASQKVAEKVGAKREGLLRNGMIIRDLMYDDAIFSIIPSDLDSSKIPG